MIRLSPRRRTLFGGVLVAALCVVPLSGCGNESGPINPQAVDGHTSYATPPPAPSSTAVSGPVNFNQDAKHKAELVKKVRPIDHRLTSSGDAYIQAFNMCSDLLAGTTVAQEKPIMAARMGVDANSAELSKLIVVFHETICPRIPLHAGASPG